MKRILLISLALALCVIPVRTEPWGGRTMTVTSGAAERIVTISTIVSSFLVQMDPASSAGLGYLLYAPVGTTCLKGADGTTLIATLSPATSTAPGGNVTVPSNPDPQGGVNLSGYCFQGSHTGDTATVSWNIRN